MRVRFVGLVLLLSAFLLAAGFAAAATIQGKVCDETGAPVADGYVYVYVEGGDKTHGPAAFMSGASGLDGGYMVLLPPGEYFAVARKRASGATSGPIAKGDLVSGMAVKIAVNEGVEMKLDFTMRPFGGKMLFNSRAVRSGGSGVTGVVEDRNGKPVAGAYAFAYAGGMKRKSSPDFVSSWTDETGGFTLFLPAGSDYFIGARVRYPGMPSQDEPYGRLNEGRLVKIMDGRFVENVKITLKTFGEYKK
ncbi:MAG: hypothetical protein HZA20_10660 [Nitrospirae bacterium]|nr:hypothetical protein [Nitrospirota bacterium]